MPLAMTAMKRRVDGLAIIGGLVILVDTAWGGLLSLGLDPARANELTLGISFVLGLPLYLLDLWIGKRIALSMLGLFFFRWIATCFAGPSFVLCNPFRGSVLLILAFVLLQLSKLRVGQRTKPTSSLTGIHSSASDSDASNDTEDYA
jgi:hypothetical protein